MTSDRFGARTKDGSGEETETLAPPVTGLLRRRQHQVTEPMQAQSMKQYRIIARLAAEPRAVELEVAAPIGTPMAAPFERSLELTGVKALSTAIFKTVSHVVLVAKLVEDDGEPLDARRTARTIEAVRTQLNARFAESPAWAA